MKVALISANLGTNSHDRLFVQQDFCVDVYRFNDQNFPPRASMTPRLQAKIPKMLGFDLIPGYDIYVWVDASFSIEKSDSVLWLIEKCYNSDFAFFKHPHRNNAYEEAMYLNREIERGNQYIISRYANEVYKEEWFKTNGLYACGVFAYKTNGVTKSLLRDWFYECSRFHINDQLSLPFLIEKYNPKVNVIQENILHNHHFIHHRHK